MSVSFEFLSSAWLLGIPREQLLSKRQKSTEEPQGTVSPVVVGLCLSFTRIQKSRSSHVSGGQGGYTIRNWTEVPKTVVPVL